jgi:DNA-binding NtrC family response regulator
MKALISWIGHMDLRAMAASAPVAMRKRISGLVRDNLEPPEDGKGPLKTMVEVREFDAVHLLADIPADIAEHFAQWLGVPVALHKVDLHGPTNYREVFQIADAELAKVTAGVSPELHYLLSPGTPTMAAVWVLLGKTKYPGRFWQTWQGKATETEIPFDITLDVVPRLLRGADSHLQHLAARGPSELQGFEGIVGDSPAIRLAAGRAKKAALRDVPVLLSGESGTGKEMFAHAIHAAGHRRDKPFLAINCAALPKPLLESELFGHVKGAFTGADKARDGAFRRADGGTLFLDEIGECDPEIQAKLLRVLQPPPGAGPCAREFTKVGGHTVEQADVRVIAATNRSLVDRVALGKFREDLYYRLAVITLLLPPLRERAADALLIAERLLERINQDFSKQELGYEHKKLSSNAKYFVRTHNWPGNVRELYNTLLQAAVMSESTELTAEDLRAAVPEPVRKDRPGADLLEQPLGDGFVLDTLLEKVRSHYLIRAMRESNGVKTRAADLLGFRNYQTLDHQLRRLNIEWEQ